MTKNELRDKYRAMRLAMDSRDVENYSLMICRQAYKEVDWRRLQKVCSYEPVAELKEVNLLPLLQTVKYKHPGIMIKLVSMSKQAKLPKAQFDLIFVPVLAFDRHKNRLGWGGGWYDRFLASQSSALKVGLAYRASLVGRGLPSQTHDVKLDMIVTEQRIYR